MAMHLRYLCYTCQPVEQTFDSDSKRFLYENPLALQLRRFDRNRNGAIPHLHCSYDVFDEKCALLLNVHLVAGAYPMFGIAFSQANARGRGVFAGIVEN